MNAVRLGRFQSRLSELRYSVDVMAIETRTIIFGEQELAEAAYGFCAREGVDMPGSEIDRVICDEGAGGAVTLVFNDAYRTLTLNGEQMTEAVIAYCARAGIPLPLYARKRLSLTGDSLALVMRLPEFVGEAAPVRSQSRSGAEEEPLDLRS